MRNKKNKGDGGQLLLPLQLRLLRRAARRTPRATCKCVREQAEKKGRGREKNGFSVLERRRGHRKPSRRGPRFALDSVARPPLIALISLA